MAGSLYRLTAQGEQGEDDEEESIKEEEQAEEVRTVTASTGSSTLRTWRMKRELGRTARPPTIPPRAAAQGSKVAHPEVITCACNEEKLHF